MPASAEAAPHITRLEPTTIRRGSSHHLAITGAGFAAGTRVVLGRGGEASNAVSVASLRRIDDARLELEVVVADDAPLGQYTVTLVTRGGIRSNRIFLEVGL